MRSYLKTSGDLSDRDFSTGKQTLGTPKNGFFLNGWKFGNGDFQAFFECKDLESSN